MNKSSHLAVASVALLISSQVGAQEATGAGAADAAQANNPLANFAAVNLQNYCIGELTAP